MSQQIQIVKPMWSSYRDSEERLDGQRSHAFEENMEGRRKDGGKKMKCGTCDSYDHNKRTCKEPS